MEELKKKREAAAAELRRLNTLIKTGNVYEFDSGRHCFLCF